MRPHARVMATVGALFMAACSAGHEQARQASHAAEVPQGEELIIAAVARAAYLPVSGSAEPVREATLSTKLMGSVTEVGVHEGEVVRRGQPLLRIDARDIAAKAAQLEAALSEAEAVHREAELHARRMRALYEEDAAPKAQLDAAETGLARARAGVEAVRANGAELATLGEYAVIRAPFNGTVVRRMVDPGSFAAPGSPLLVLQDDSALRIAATASPDVARGLVRGQEITATIEGETVTARIEGVVPSAGGNLYTVNAIVPNADHRLVVRGSATLALPLGVRSTFVVPERALVRQADLIGVYLRRGGSTLLRWVRTGPVAADSVEVVAGLRDGDVIVIPAPRSESVVFSPEEASLDLKAPEVW